MTTQNRFPFLANRVPPYMLEDAMSIVSDVVNGSGFEGLTGAVFSSVEQFRQAMSDCGWNLRYKELKKNAEHVSYTAELIDKDGAEWWMLLQSWSQDYLLVCNVVQVKKGNAPQENPQ